MMLAVEVPHAISGTVHTTFGVPGDHCSEHSLLPLQPANHPICLRPNPFESRTLLHTIRVQPLLINMEPVPIRSRRGIGLYSWVQAIHHQFSLARAPSTRASISFADICTLLLQ